MRRVLQGKGGEGDEGAVHFQTMQLTRGAQARWHFLAVQNSSIGDLVPWSVRPSVTTNNQTLQSDPRDLRPLRHLIRVMKRHDLTGLFWCDSRDL